MSFLSIQKVSKKFGEFIANDAVSLEIKKGIVYGLLGPNGAGKTTLIRMITRIMIPDSGAIFFDGKTQTDASTQKIGYMPEERGLYKNMKIGELLEYLAKLKGLSHKEAVSKTNFWLDKFNIQSWRNKKIDELSKGMSQKIQFIATVLHHPDLIILDEPFSGLDPVNGQLIEDEIAALKAAGKTIIFSTHRMEQVEQICDEIALVSKGKIVLEGEVKGLKHRFKKGVFQIELAENSPPIIDTADVVVKSNEENQWLIATPLSGSDLLKALLIQQIEIVSFAEKLPTIQEIFIEQVKNDYA